MSDDVQNPVREVPAIDLAPDGSPREHLRPMSALVPVPQRTRRWPWLVGAGLLFLLIGTAVWHWSRSGPPLRYATAPVDRGPITSVVTATGTINPVVSVQVGSQVSGKIAHLFADFNSVVTKGQVLAQIDQQPFKARLDQARASVKSATGNLEKAKNLARQRKRERDRMAVLRTQAFVSQADLDLAETNYRDAAAHVDVVQAQLDQAQAALDAAELDLGYTTIYSPVNGIVISRNVDVGQTLAAAFQTPVLFVIAQDLTRMQVNANVSESDIGGVTEGTEATFRVDAYPKRLFSGVVTQVRNAPISIQNVVTYDVVIAVENPALILKPGMTANITIVTARKDNPLRVPNAALRFRMPNIPVDRKSTQVWRLEHGRPRRVPVTTGIADSLFTEIEEGPLQEGDVVIVGLDTPEEQAQKKLPPGFDAGPRMR